MLWRVTGAALVAALALTAPAANAAYPGANGRIAFQRGIDALYTMDAGGGNQALVVQSATCSGTWPNGESHSCLVDGHPSWSPDGSRMAFECFDGDNGDVWVCTVGAGGAAVRFAASGGVEGIEGPSWSPDGNKLAYTDNYTFGESFFSLLRTAKTNNTDHVDVSVTAAGNPFSAAWSPLGTKIAFSGDAGGDREVYLVSPTGGPVTQLTANAAFDAEPSWSPDGQRIAFTSGRDGNGEIYVMNADGSSQTRLTNDPAADSNPAWSPDGRKIVFDSNRDEPNPSGCGVFNCNVEIYSMNADGSNIQRLTNNPGRDENPDWQPLGGLAPYPRPGGATPAFVPLVPAFEQCTAPNSTHVSPLSQGSCEPPVQVSDLLTTSKIGQGLGSVRLDAVVGNPSTPGDEADVKLETLISDVRNASDQSDYTGDVILSSTIRTTDRANGFGGVSGTSADARMDVSLSCVPTAAAPKGSDCGLTTTLDALVPGMILEGKRTILATRSFAVLDAGLDGDVSTPACPPSCGTGDEEVYLEQGAFTP